MQPVCRLLSTKRFRFCNREVRILIRTFHHGDSEIAASRGLDAAIRVDLQERQDRVDGETLDRVVELDLAAGAVVEGEQADVGEDPDRRIRIALRAAAHAGGRHREPASQDPGRNRTRVDEAARRRDFDARRGDVRGPHVVESARPCSTGG